MWKMTDREASILRGIHRGSVAGITGTYHHTWQDYPLQITSVLVTVTNTVYILSEQLHSSFKEY